MAKLKIKRPAAAEMLAKKLLYEYFQGDIGKINNWYLTSNPSMGDITPVSLISTNPNKLWSFIINQIEGQIP